MKLFDLGMNYEGGLFYYCYDDNRDQYNRMLIGLSPAGDPLVEEIKKSLELIFSSTEFSLMEFSSNEEFSAYMEDDWYELDEDRPGICFGVSVDSSEIGDYQVSYHFEDQSERSGQANIPFQQNPPSSKYKRIPQS